MNRLKSLLKSGKVVTGCFAFGRSPVLIEVLGRCGLDFVIIDMEHTGADWSEVERLLVAARAAGISAVVRIKTTAEDQLLTALDLGVDGIMLPFVQTAADVRRVADASYYQPEGHRHYCSFSRAWGYGTTEPARYLEHMRSLNDDVLIWGLIEDRQTVQNLPEMVAVTPGLDIFSVGMGDLAASMGLPGQTSHPQVQAVFNEACDAARNCGRDIPVGIGIYDVTDPAQLRPWMDRGFRVFMCISDTALVTKAARTFVSLVRT